MLKSVARLVLSLMWSFAAPLAFAAELAPDAQMKALSEEVIAAIKKDKDLHAGNPKKIAELVEIKVMPHFDFRRMTQIAMGANWRRATPQQQDQLALAFKTLLIRTYSGAVTGYNDQVIEFKPAHLRPGDTDVTVRSQMKQTGAEALAIDYQMARADTGWKVYDVKVGGVSLVTTYRESFADVVRNRGVDGLIETLGSKNRDNNAKAASKS